MKGLHKQWSRVIPLGLFVFEFFYLAYIHSWEVDPHHDGIMYTAAVGVYEGRIPNRDFFAQYGPVSPIIQGLWFRLTEPTVWSLKILTSLGLALIGLLIYCGAKRRLSSPTSALLSICWMLSGPFGLPWSSVFSTIFILVSLLLLESILNYQHQRRNRHYGFLIGVLLAIGTFTRIHTVIVYFAIILGFLVLRDRRKYFGTSAALTLGFLLTLCSTTLALAKSNALVGYIEQCILWASGRYAGGPELSISFFFNLAWIPLFGVINLIILNRLVQCNDFKCRSTFKIILPVFLVYSMFVLLSQLPRSGPETLRNPRILAIISGQKAQFSFNFLLLTYFAGLIFYMLYKSSRYLDVGFIAGTKSQIVYILLAIATLTQLYPFADEYHIAFVAPVVIVTCIFLLPQNSKVDKYQMAFCALAIALIPTLIAHSLILANVQRTKFTSKTLSGMYGSWQSSKPLDLTMRHLEREEPGINFICADGLYAGAGGRYLAADEKFVTWGPPSKEILVVDREFVCSADQHLISSYLEQGWQVIFKVLLSPTTDHSGNSYWNVLFERIPTAATKEGAR